MRFKNFLAFFGFPQPALLTHQANEVYAYKMSPILLKADNMKISFCFVFILGLGLSPD